jgi:hypothetical protein
VRLTDFQRELCTSSRWDSPEVTHAHRNQRSLWDAGCRFDFANPDYR